VQHPKGATAQQVCHYLHRIAEENASSEEKKYLGIIKHRIENGSLSDLILKEVTKKVLKTNLEEAVFSVYSSLANCLENNKVYI
jgi:replicative superfamily II helicase